jgi:hypothetical protein
MSNDMIYDYELKVSWSARFAALLRGNFRLFRTGVIRFVCSPTATMEELRSVADAPPLETNRANGVAPFHAGQQPADSP